MDLDQCLVEGKWRILTELGKKDQAASDLAKLLKTSIANINHQLTLLEAFGVIKKERTEQTGKAGKPKTIYGLKKSQQFMVFIKKGLVKKIRLPDFWIYDLIATIQDTLDERDAYYLLKFCFQTEEILKKCQGIAFMKSTQDTMELVLLTKDVERIRKEYSNVLIKDLDEKQKKIVCWTHDEKEIKEGLSRKEAYFLNLLADVSILFDKEGKLAELRKMREIP